MLLLLDNVCIGAVLYLFGNKQKCIFSTKNTFRCSIRIGSLKSLNKSYALLQNILNVFESFNDLHKSLERRTLETFVDLDF